MRLITLLASSQAVICSLLPQEPLSGQFVAQLANSELQLPDYPKYDPKNTTASLLALHKALVNIPSVSGSEGTISHWLQHYLQSLNYTVHLQELPSSSKKRYNILASQDSSLKTPLLLSTHIDTVPPFIPFSRSDSPGQNATLHGRGSNDAKASLSAQVIALTSLISSGKIEKSKASLLFVSDEEVHGLGMRTANSLNPGWKAVIFGEPTESRLVAGHKGIVLFDLVAHGRAAHSGYPWLGESAIDTLVSALAGLRAAEGDLPSSERLGNSTLNIGLISGGVAGNVVASDAKASIAIRIGGGSVEEVREIVERTVKKAGGSIEVEWSGNGYGPVSCDIDISGFEIGSVNYGTDVPNLKGQHLRYLYGPGSILSAHSDHEAVDEGDLIAAVEGYQKLILGALENINGV